MAMKVFALALFTTFFFLIVMQGNNVLPDEGVAYAQDTWKDEFDDVCSKTQDAMGLTPDELKALVKKCDELKPRIEKLSGAQKRVYLRRLKMCRDLYVFVLESKENK